MNMEEKLEKLQKEIEELKRKSERIENNIDGDNIKTIKLKIYERGDS